MSYIEICLISARNLKPIGFENKEEKDRTVDPYAIIKYNDNSENSKIIYNDINPRWRQSFYFNCVDKKSAKVEVVLFDKELSASDLSIGKVKTTFTDLKLNDYTNVWVDVTNGEGKVHIGACLRNFDYPGVMKSKAGAKDKHFQEQVNRAWAGAIVKPENAPSATNKLPPENLVLEHIYGYRTRDTRDNLFSLDPDTIVYHAASVGIVHNIKKNTQRFFIGNHFDDILCLTKHPGNRYIATGDVVNVNGEGPCVAIWDAKSPESAPVVKFKVGEGKVMRNIATMGFGCDGESLVLVTGDNYHSVHFYNWKTKTLLCSDKGHSDKILDLDNHPVEPNSFVTVGVKHVKFWKFDGTTKRFTSKKGIFGKANIQTVLCPLYIGKGDILLTGTYSGEIYVWDTNKCEVTNIIQTGHNSIYGTAYNPEFGLVTGHRDGYVTLFDIDDKTGKMKKIQEVNVGYSVKSLDYASNGDLIIGTSESSIFRIKSFKKSSLKTDLELLFSNHSSAKMEELWGLDGNPNDDTEFVTVSDDGNVIIWDTINFKQKIFKSFQNKKLRSVSYSPKADRLYVGCVSGDILILNTKDLSLVKEIPYEKRSFIKSKEHNITVIKCSPDGTKFATASRDCVINVYGVSALNRIGTLTGHSSTIVHMDWSKDSKYIQSDSTDCELLYWNIRDMVQVTKMDEVKPILWETWSLYIGWPVQSIWESGWSNSTINAVARNKKEKLLVTADDNSQVRLFSYPVVLDKQPCKKYLGHSSHVTNTIFLGNNYVISTGGMDGSIFQWRIKD